MTGHLKTFAFEVPCQQIMRVEFVIAEFRMLVNLCRLSVFTIDQPSRIKSMFGCTFKLNARSSLSSPLIVFSIMS